MAAAAAAGVVACRKAHGSALAIFGVRGHVKHMIPALTVPFIHPNCLLIIFVELALRKYVATGIQEIDTST